MPWSFPTDFVAAIAKAIHDFGETVDFTQIMDGGATLEDVPAVISRPGTQSLTGGAIQEGYSVWIVATDMPLEPVRFDRLTFDGTTFAIDEPLQHRGKSGVLCWELRCTS